MCRVSTPPHGASRRHLPWGYIGSRAGTVHVLCRSPQLHHQTMSRNRMQCPPSCSSNMDEFAPNDFAKRSARSLQVRLGHPVQRRILEIAMGRLHRSHACTARWGWLVFRWGRLGRQLQRCQCISDKDQGAWKTGSQHYDVLESPWMPPT